MARVTFGWKAAGGLTHRLPESTSNEHALLVSEIVREVVRERRMLIHDIAEFLKDKGRNAFMFALFSLLAFYIWWDLDDEGSLVAGVICAGISAQQAYRFYLSKRRQKHESPIEGDGRP